MEILFLIGRILYGGYFVLSGVNHFKMMEGLTAYAKSKKVPAPQAAVVIGGLLLIFGGLGVLLGTMIPYAVSALILFLLPVSFQMHDFWAMTDQQEKMTNQINFMKNIALVGAALMMLMTKMPWPLAI